jgi:RND superfamily putative drug exporter
MAAAVLIDATIVRLVLVPSTMELLGSANWWLPRWLGKILPRIEVDHAAPDAERGEPGTDGLFVTRAPVAEPAADGRERVHTP